MTKEKEMSFLAHLEELRWHLVRIAVAIVVLAIIIFAFQTVVFEKFVFAHLKSDFTTYQSFCNLFSFFGLETEFCNINFPQELQSIKPMQQLMSSIWTSLILGLIISFPYVIWEVWRFIAPGLYKNELKKSRGFIWVSSLLFFVGALFSFYIIIPISVFFFYSYQISELVSNKFTLDSYISLFTNKINSSSI